MTDNSNKSPGLAPGQVHDLAELAQACEDSIVSRALVNAKSGSLTLFAFAEGQKLSEHTCPYDAVAHVLDGAAEITVAGVPHVVRAGQALLMPANAPHAVHARQSFKMLLTMFKTQGE